MLGLVLGCRILLKMCLMVWWWLERISLVWVMLLILDLWLGLWSWLVFVVFVFEMWMVYFGMCVMGRLCVLVICCRVGCGWLLILLCFMMLILSRCRWWCLLLWLVCSRCLNGSGWFLRSLRCGVLSWFWLRWLWFGWLWRFVLGLRMMLCVNCVWGWSECLMSWVWSCLCLIWLFLWVMKVCEWFYFVYGCGWWIGWW